MSGSRKIYNTKGYILSFWSTFYLKTWRSYGNFKFWPIFGPDDVIDDVINTKNYTDLARSKIHIPVKFGVDCSNGATCIVTITDKQTNRQTDKPSDEHTCKISKKFWQVINRDQKWINHVQNYPIPLIWGRRLRIWSQIEAALNN